MLDRDAIIVIEFLVKLNEAMLYGGYRASYSPIIVMDL